MARHKASVRKKSPQQQTQMLKSRIEASETRALSETARVYCAGHRSESNKAAKQHQRDIKAFVSAYIESDTTQRAKEARRTERSLIQAKKDRRDFRTVGLPPHKMSYRIFKLRFPASSYQRACDPHHIDNLNFGRSVKANDSGWATILLSFFCSALNAILPLYTFICCLHEASCPPQLPFFVPTLLWMTTALSLAVNALAQQASDSQVEEAAEEDVAQQKRRETQRYDRDPWLFTHRPHCKLWRSVRGSSLDIL